MAKNNTAANTAKASTAKNTPATTELTDEQKSEAAKAAGVETFEELSEEQKAEAIAAIAAKATVSGKKATVHLRVLLDQEINGVKVLANQVISTDAAKAKELVEAGAADDHKAAVAYAKSLCADVVSL